MSERVIDRDCAIIAAWIRRQVHGVGDVPSYRRDNQLTDRTAWSARDGAAIFSYGTHFTIAEVYRPRGRRPLIVLNGDRWGGSGGWHVSRTPAHQDQARQTAGELALAGCADVCIIPMNALTAAGIDRGSIRVLEQREDETLYLSRPLAVDIDDVGTADRSERMRDWQDREYGTRYVWRDIATGRDAVREIPDDDDGERSETSFTKTPSATWRHAADLLRDMDGAWSEHWTEHRLGELLFTARAGSVRRRRRFVSSFDYQEREPLYFLAELPTASRAQTVADAIEDMAPRAVHAAMARSLAVYRQGDIFAVQTSLTDADVYGRAVTRARLAPFRGNGRLRKGETGWTEPARRYRMIAERYAALRAHAPLSPSAPYRPRRNRRRSGIQPAPAFLLQRAAAEATGRAAAAVDIRRANRAANRPTRRTAAAAMRTAVLLGTPSGVFASTFAAVPAEHRAAVLERYRAERAEHPPTMKTARRYPPLAQYSSIRQVAEYPAKELERVQRERRGRRTAERNQTVPMRADDCYRQSVFDVDALARVPTARALTFYGTAHTATEVVKTKGGAIYARGRMVHATELETVLDGTGWGSRAPDHRPVPLGDRKTWHLIIRNTVPRAR